MGKERGLDALTHMRAAIFDLDGTVLDSMWIWADINERFLRSRGVAMPEGYLEIMSSMGFLEAARYTVNRFGLADDPQTLCTHYQDASCDYYKNRIGLKPGAGEYLRRLKARGVKMGIATASVERVFLPALRRNGIDGLFDVVVSSDDVRRGKDFPDIYLEAARRLHTPPEHCVVFEDILSGTRSAKSVGMAVVGVYDDSARHDRAAIEAVADVFIKEYAELG